MICYLDSRHVVYPSILLSFIPTTSSIFPVILFPGANEARGGAKKGRIEDKASVGHIGQIEEEGGGGGKSDRAERERGILCDIDTGVEEGKKRGWEVKN